MHEKKTLALALVDRFEQEFACRRLWFSNDASLTPQKLQFSFFSNLPLRISLHQNIGLQKTLHSNVMHYCVWSLLPVVTQNCRRDIHVESMDNLKTCLASVRNDMLQVTL